MNATEFKIDGTPQLPGKHWETMGKAEDHLALMLTNLRDEIESEDGLGEWLEGILDVNVARWEDGTVGRLVLLLGFGGPNIYMDVACDREGKPERVTLDRYWSGHDMAWTDDHAALEIVTELLPYWEQ